jgi:hypothetical protein
LAVLAKWVFIIAGLAVVIRAGTPPGCDLVWTMDGLEAAAGNGRPLLEQSYPTPVGAPQPIQVLWVLERGRVAERLGSRTAALSTYQSVADVWQHADTALQPYVGQARDGLRRLRPSRVT